MMYLLWLLVALLPLLATTLFVGVSEDWKVEEKASCILGINLFIFITQACILLSLYVYPLSFLG